MRPLSRNALLTAGGAARAVTSYRLLAARRDGGPAPARSHTVTVFRPVEQVAAPLPEPLTAPGAGVSIDFAPAPGDRGTEIIVRRQDDSVTDGDIRAALRTARSLLETGDVLLAGGPTTEPTLFNKPLRAMTRRGREGGLL